MCIPYLNVETKAFDSDSTMCHFNKRRLSNSWLLWAYPFNTWNYSWSVSDAERKEHFSREICKCLKLLCWRSLVIIDRGRSVSHTNYNYIQLSKMSLSVAEHVVTAGGIACRKLLMAPLVSVQCSFNPLQKSSAKENNEPDKTAAFSGPRSLQQNIAVLVSVWMWTKGIRGWKVLAAVGISWNTNERLH